ncbi:peptide deformylase [bacterium]|nr:peptide deformylase [bacterium]
MELAIVEIGNPILREVSEEVSASEIKTDSFQSFVDNLIETKRIANGAGLAAPQVSVLKRVFVVENIDNPRYPYMPNIPLTVVINPRITFLSEERYNIYDGCLSIPHLRGVVDRYAEIRVEGLDRHGSPLDFIVKGISTGPFQHEDDHLNGILFPDKVKDSKTFCTIGEFKNRYEHDFRQEVEALIKKYGS